MKPQLLKIPGTADQSFSIRKDILPNINNRWHYHTEIELICFHKGGGTQFVGDSIDRFSAGDIVLVGSKLPHYWRYDKAYLNTFEEKNRDAFSTVIHFFDNFLGERFLFLPEFKSVRVLLEKAKNGILIKGAHVKLITAKIENVYNSKGPEKVIALLSCLVAIAKLPNLSPLSSIGFNYTFRESESAKMNDIYNFALNNFKNKIHLAEIAAVADMVPNSFCRFFKIRTGKTFSHFISEVRVGYACKLILENKMEIKQICFESGFNNFTCFHKTFKLITGKTPKLYQSMHTVS